MISSLNSKELIGRYGEERNNDEKIILMKIKKEK